MSRKPRASRVEDADRDPMPHKIDAKTRTDGSEDPVNPSKFVRSSGFRSQGLAVSPGRDCPRTGSLSGSAGAWASGGRLRLQSARGGQLRDRRPAVPRRERQVRLALLPADPGAGVRAVRLPGPETRRYVSHLRARVLRRPGDTEPRLLLRTLPPIHAPGAISRRAFRGHYDRDGGDQLARRPGNRPRLRPVRAGPVRRLHGQQRGGRSLWAGHRADAGPFEPAPDSPGDRPARHEDRPTGLGRCSARAAWARAARSPGAAWRCSSASRCGRTTPGWRPRTVISAGTSRTSAGSRAGAGAQTVLCTVGTNLRDCPPFASLHRPDLTAGAAQELGGRLQAGRGSPVAGQVRRGDCILPAGRRDRRFVRGAAVPAGPMLPACGRL